MKNSDRQPPLCSASTVLLHTSHCFESGNGCFDGVPEALTDERLEQIYGKAIFEEKAGETHEIERDRSL